MILQISTAQSLPFQGRWLGGAETERSSRICDSLSVRLADSSPAREAFGVRSVGAGLCSAPTKCRANKDNLPAKRCRPANPACTFY